MAVIFAAAVWKRVYLTLSINNVVRTSDPLRVGLIGLFFNSLSFISQIDMWCFSLHAETFWIFCTVFDKMSKC